jgi:hypothetical protein
LRPRVTGFRRLFTANRRGIPRLSKNRFLQRICGCFPGEHA